MKKVLFTGATGLLGKYFLANVPPGYEVIGTYNSNLRARKKFFLRLDITSKRKTGLLIKGVKPDIVVHAASIGSVDYCELHEKEANEVNVKGTINVVEACRLAGAKLIFISSNAVYDGENPPYSEDSPRKPLDEYGRTKVKGENIVSTSGLPYNIHLYAGSASEALWSIIERGKPNEVYNVSGKDCITRFELAKKVADVFSLDSSLINPVKSDFFKNIAPRPKNTCFNTEKIEKEFKIRPLGVIEGLSLMKNE